MLEIWRRPPEEVLRLARYLMTPPGAILFLAAVPLVWAVPRRMFRGALLACSLALLLFSWGPTFAALLLTLLLAAYPLAKRRSAAVTAGSVILLEAAYFALFFLPLSRLPIYGSPRLRQMYPGLLTDRELVFYLGLAFTNLRLLHLVLGGRPERNGRPLTLRRYLLYLLYAPTYRLGPFVAYDDFDSEVDTARGRITRADVLSGLAETLLGAVIFEGVVKVIDGLFFKRFGPDDGSYWYLWFFERPPESRLAVLIGIYVIAIRYYLFVKAYSHVARGMSRMIGVRLPGNMRWPLLASNLGAFWRRYHVTVSEFAQVHVMKPIAERFRGIALPVLGAFLCTSLLHHPAFHSVLFGVLQALGLGIWTLWRIARSRWKPLRVARGAIPAGARRGIAILLTLNFVVWTVPVLLDRNHGGLLLFERLWRSP